MRSTPIYAALAIAVLGAVLFQIREKRYVRDVTGGQMLGVIRVVQDIPAGQPIFQQSIAVEYRPAGYVEERHIGVEDALEVVGLLSSHEIRLGSVLVWSDLARTRRSGRHRGEESISDGIAPGSRAINIELESSHHNSLLMPGDRVDLLFTAMREGVDVSTTILLAQNVSIMTEETTMEARRATHHWTQSVTLTANPVQAMAIEHAAQYGTIAFAVRQSEDRQVVERLPFITSEDLVEPEIREQVTRSRRHRPTLIEHIE